MESFFHLGSAALSWVEQANSALTEHPMPRYRVTSVNVIGNLWDFLLEELFILHKTDYTSKFLIMQFVLKCEGQTTLSTHKWPFWFLKHKPSVPNDHQSFGFIIFSSVDLPFEAIFAPEIAITFFKNKGYTVGIILHSFLT